ncbi:hypothetical protein BJ875DRAFT_136711 [Amylocarpus encephaloides]|uniref:C2H2-type domain-containing protein n=1 Tax=Amylocarpus encephaloides TaxID=45428 RepID=A0A9P7YQ20_9HELO|nr:hypothetical protein BJ875DRAFT_136711 [Amylocarpus encephaloides]
MSSTTYNPPTFVDPQASRDFVDVKDPQLNNNTSDNNHLSPFPSSQTASNSASPSNNPNSISGDSYSEYSPYQPSDFSELEDQFFGVDFNAVYRTDSLPSNITTTTSYQPPNLNRALPDLPFEIENKPDSDTYTASTYPLSPVHTSISNTPSPNLVNDRKLNVTISPHELNNDFNLSRYQNFESGVPPNTANPQLTPDQSGSSHTSAEGVEPSAMAGLDRSPHVTVSQWTQGYSQHQADNVVSSAMPYTNQDNLATSFAESGVSQNLPAPVTRADDGSWKSDERTGQAGLDPENRRMMYDDLVITLDEQAERRRIMNKNIEVHEWRSQAGGSSEAEDERPAQSYFRLPANNQSWYQQSGSRRHRDPSEAENYIDPIDDGISIRENRLVEGQVYFDPKGGNVTEDDVHLMNQPRQWNDGPSVPFILTTTFQPATSNDAMERFRRHADTMSIASRAATWGTRRRSEPSLADMDSVANGSFLKKLSISRPAEGRQRQHSIFDQGLDRLASIVRKRSDSKLSTSKLKRTHSVHNVSDELHIQSASRQNSGGSLAPPPRTSSFGKRSTPSINTAMAAMAGPLAAVGTTHARNGSVSATGTSPKSPSHLGWPSRVINRARSRSDLTQTQSNVGQSGLAGLWRGHGGPPVPTLASPPVENETRQPEIQDQDDEDDEEDEQMDEGDIKTEEAQADPIIPNYDGFKAHVRRLNPDMDPRYNWLVSRIAHQQEIRYKNLLDLRVKHSQALSNRACGSGRLCVALGGSAMLLDTKGNPKEAGQPGPGLQLVTDFSDDDSNPGEGALTEETFPTGVPMPPTKNLPAEFECQLCFKAKKFQKPSDWTKHVHEDVQPFTCTYDKCKEPKSFKRKADWVRHENERHRHLEWWICQVDDCSHPCYRKDNFLQHLVREHKLPEPKQKTKAAIKKARLTEPAWRMLEQCHHETEKRPLDEPCKFCGRSFATWKKLTVHLAKHMEHLSLPILKLVEARSVDASTIISPVEQNLTPSTPISRTKMESLSPFNMSNVSPIPMTNQSFTPSGYDQTAFFPASGPAGGFGMSSQLGPDLFTPTNMYADNSFAVRQVDQPRPFGPIDSGGLGQVNQARGFRSSDAGFQQHQRTPSRPYGSMDANFTQQLPEQSFLPTPTSAFSMSQDFTSAPAAVSNYPAANVLGIQDGSFAYNPLTVNTTQSFQPQVPMTQGPGSGQSYRHPSQNIPYYGQQ